MEINTFPQPALPMNPTPFPDYGRPSDGQSRSPSGVMGLIPQLPGVQVLESPQQSVSSCREPPINQTEGHAFPREVLIQRPISVGT